MMQKGRIVSLIKKLSIGKMIAAANKIKIYGVVIWLPQFPYYVI